MEKKRVILFGFKKMEEIMVAATVRELTDSPELEVMADFAELENADSSTLVDVVVVCAEYIGFEVNKRMKRVTEICPEATLMCISLIKLSPYICWKFVKNGVDIMLCNIESEVEYQRAFAAIRKGRPYYPEELRRSIDNNELCEHRGLNIISKKEREALEMTVEGYALKEIAYRMHIREATVCKMRTNAFRKTGVQNLPELIKLAMTFNLHYAKDRENAV